MSWTYCRIKDKDLVGRFQGIGKAEIYVDGDWIHDQNIISDRIVGYDVTEPSGSPYRMGSTEVMGYLEEISEEKAMKLIEDQSN
jgi:hypothetical protein